MSHLLNIQFLLLLFIAEPSIERENKDKIIGFWDAEKAVVEIHKKDGKYIGNPVSPEGSRIEAIEVLNLEFNDEQWVGKIYSKEKDKLFNVACDLAENKLLLTVKSGMFSKEIEWIRVK